jgi:hypothetical protein
MVHKRFRLTTPYCFFFSYSLSPPLFCTTIYRRPCGFAVRWIASSTSRPTCRMHTRSVTIISHNCSIRFIILAKMGAISVDCLRVLREVMVVGGPRPSRDIRIYYCLKLVEGETLVRRTRFNHRRHERTDLCRPLRHRRGVLLEDQLIPPCWLRGQTLVFISDSVARSVAGRRQGKAA